MRQDDEEITGSVEAERREAIEDLQDRLDDNETWEEFVERYAPSTLGFHEAVHTASLAADFVARGLLDHPSVVLDPGLYARATAALDALLELHTALTLVHVGADAPLDS